MKSAQPAELNMAAKQQYLTFCIGNEKFGMVLGQTREVIEYGGITQVPLMPAFLTGVINLRGEVVPVIDLAVRLGRPPIEIRRRTCIIIVEMQHDGQEFTLGLLADSVYEVLELDADGVEPAPAFGANLRSEFILGIARQGEEFIVLLDADRTLSLRELAKLVEAEFE